MLALFWTFSSYSSKNSLWIVSRIGVKNCLTFLTSVKRRRHLIHFDFHLVFLHNFIKCFETSCKCFTFLLSGHSVEISCFFRFYVKSRLGNLEVQELSIWQFPRLWTFVFTILTLTVSTFFWQIFSRLFVTFYTWSILASIGMTQQIISLIWTLKNGILASLIGFKSCRIKFESISVQKC